MPLFKTPSARANVQPVDIQATRNNFPYAMAFVQPEPINRVEMQPVQERGLRWLGNLDQLIERERARLKLEFAEGKVPVVTPGSGPVAPGVLPPNVSVTVNAGGGYSSGGLMPPNGGFSGGCK